MQVFPSVIPMEFAEQSLIVSFNNLLLNAQPVVWCSRSVVSHDSSSSCLTQTNNLYSYNELLLSKGKNVSLHGNYIKFHVVEYIFVSGKNCNLCARKTIYSWGKLERLVARTSSPNGSSDLHLIIVHWNALLNIWLVMFR